MLVDDHHLVDGDDDADAIKVSKCEWGKKSSGIITITIIIITVHCTLMYSKLDLLYLTSPKKLGWGRYRLHWRNVTWHYLQ